MNRAAERAGRPDGAAGRPNRSVFGPRRRLVSHEILFDLRLVAFGRLSPAFIHFSSPADVRMIRKGQRPSAAHFGHQPEEFGSFGMDERPQTFFSWPLALLLQ